MSALNGIRVVELAHELALGPIRLAPQTAH